MTDIKTISAKPEPQANSNSPIRIEVVAEVGQVSKVMPSQAELYFWPIFQPPQQPSQPTDGDADQLGDELGLSDGLAEGDSEGLSDGSAEGLPDGASVAKGPA